MVKVTALYLGFEGAQFNHVYYRTEHMRITRDALRTLGLLRLESEQALQAAPDQAGHVVAASSAYFSTAESAQAALAQAGALLSADLPNYTNIKPRMHVSAVLTHLAPASQETS